MLDGNYPLKKNKQLREDLKETLEAILAEHGGLSQSKSNSKTILARSIGVPKDEYWLIATLIAALEGDITTLS